MFVYFFQTQRTFKKIRAFSSSCDIFSDHKLPGTTDGTEPRWQTLEEVHLKTLL